MCGVKESAGAQQGKGGTAPGCGEGVEGFAQRVWHVCMRLKHLNSTMAPRRCESQAQWTSYAAASAPLPGQVKARDRNEYLHIAVIH
jgi:hypothetical protein